MGNKSIRTNILVLAVSLLIGLLMAEGIVRIVGYTDKIGQFYFKGKKIRPYISITENEAKKINYFVNHERDLYLGYDPYLGWDIRPNYTYDKLFKSNSAGIRSEPREYTVQPNQGIVRVALFGDSFVHGDEVAFTETWGYFLEQQLKKLGKEVEVINFGVPAYGIDQAYLRYKKTGYKYSPDIVIIGFQAENLERNVSLFRFFYYENEVYLPLSKPRFILLKDDIKLINSPAIEPQDLIGKIQHDPGFFSTYDYYSRTQENPLYSILLRSKLAGLIITNKDSRQNTDYYYYKKTGEGKYSLNGEPAQLGLKIIEHFVRDVQNNGSEIYLIHLPKIPDIKAAMENDHLEYQEVFDILSEKYSMIDPMVELKELAKRKSVWNLAQGNHYSAETHQLIGKVVTDFLTSRSKVLINK